MDGVNSTGPFLRVTIERRRLAHERGEMAGQSSKISKGGAVRITALLEQERFVDPAVIDKWIPRSTP
jgi:hypothetical protein